MACLNPPLRLGPPSTLKESKKYHRGLEKVPLKKAQRKLKIRLHHILLFFGLLTGLFFLMMKFCIFLMTWEELDVKKTQLTCAPEHLANELEPLLDPASLGNLLVLDLNHLKLRLEAHRWVKEARLRKVFPSTLWVEIKERIPAAILDSGSAFLLIDKDGVILEQLEKQEASSLPLLKDSSPFKEHYQEKLSKAWAFLDSISLEARTSIDSLDLSRMDTIILTFKEKSTRLLLGKDRFQEKIEFFLAALDSLEKDNGPLEYVDFRFDDRIYIKPLPVLSQVVRQESGEEVK